MRLLNLLLSSFLCVSALCQESPQPAPASRAKPSDLSISCRIDALTRTAQVTIVNHTDKTIQLRFAGPNIDYEADLTSKTGERLRHRNKGPTVPNQAWHASIATGDFASGAQYTEKVPLDNLVELPKEGGTFRIRLGRGLARLPPPHNPWELDPAKIVWCKPVEVTFPPLK